MKNQTDKQSKTKEELNALKKEVEAMNKKLAELNEEELAQVTGGNGPAFFVTDPSLTEIVHARIIDEW